MFLWMLSALNTNAFLPLKASAACWLSYYLVSADPQCLASWNRYTGCINTCFIPFIYPLRSHTLMPTQHATEKRILYKSTRVCQRDSFMAVFPAITWKTHRTHQTGQDSFTRVTVVLDWEDSCRHCENKTSGVSECLSKQTQHEGSYIHP